MIGHGFMGAAHSQGWRVAPRFFDLALDPVMQVVVGRDTERASEAAATWGWHEAATDWREVIAREDIDLVDIVTPGDTHAEIAIAALRAGKHVLCEKPLANTVVEAEAMTSAAEEAARSGVRSMVGFTYRRVPATTFARQLVAEGRLGDIRQVRAEYLQDWLSDENAPLTWRLNKDIAGSGSLGDIGAHAVDLTEYITGQTVDRVSGILETIVAERPIMAEGVGLSGTAGSERGPVTVDDLALFTGRLSGGALASFEATRFRTGRKNALRIEISGSRGALAFDLERMNELEFYDATLPDSEQGFRRVLVTEPSHPYAGRWWPTGHMLGYEHGFSHQVVDLVTAIAEGTDPTPSFADGLHVQRVLDAVERSSAADGAWQAIR
ncbi:Gfo/Idh/MocA family protein [Microbacterium sp. AK009]|uniref:Gfo/Idh/MocA family protein n=1 Tax=Microbacterium sp. AK009 TaxID=2723068 RepID=UPI0015CB2A50|nr:Gfo/Idh/MocA family oxidoreductase [Microbacterium sp. AK009]